MTFVFAICALITIANAAPLSDEGIACGLIGNGFIPLGVQYSIASRIELEGAPVHSHDCIA